MRVPEAGVFGETSMRGPLDSPRMAPGRQILAFLVLLGAALALFGCGSSEEPPSGNNIDEATAGSYLDKLEEVKERVADGKCDEGEEQGTAQSSLASLQEDVDANADESNREFTAYFQDLLDRLGDQIAEQCDPSDGETTESNSEETSSSSVAPTTSISTTESETTEPETTEPEEKEPETTTTTTDPPEPPAPPEPPTSPDQGGDDPGSGGTAPGFQPGRKTAKKPKAGKK